MEGTTIRRKSDEGFPLVEQQGEALPQFLAVDQSDRVLVQPVDERHNAALGTDMVPHVCPLSTA
jgi:hypothetical protein